MRCICRACVCVGVVLLSWGCAPDELHVGMVPKCHVSPPAGPEQDYLGTTFGVHWDAMGLEVTTNWANMDEWPWDNITTVAGTIWLGWYMTYREAGAGGKNSPKAWFVLTPSVGVYYWDIVEGDDALFEDTTVGFLVGAHVGFGVYLNEFNTIGLEYGYTTLAGTHGTDATEMQGLYFTYSIVF